MTLGRLFYQCPKRKCRHTWQESFVDVIRDADCPKCGAKGLSPVDVEDLSYTKGPWFPVPYGDGNDTVICRDEAGNQRIAFMAIPGSRDETERRKSWTEINANARLIAAAPLMFDALDASAADVAEMTNWTDEHVRGWAYAVARNATAAIAKARGGA